MANRKHGFNVGPTGFDPSLALDSQDRPHITYGDLFYGTPDDSDLKYAYWDGNQWQKETIDTKDQSWAELFNCFG